MFTFCISIWTCPNPRLINENKKVKIGKIKFVGNTAFSDWKLRRELKNTKQQRWYLFWRSYFDNEKFNEDIESLTDFYKNKGYRDFTFLSDSIGYSHNKKRMNLYIKVSIPFSPLSVDFVTPDTKIGQKWVKN